VAKCGPRAAICPPLCYIITNELQLPRQCSTRKGVAFSRHRSLLNGALAGVGLLIERSLPSAYLSLFNSLSVKSSIVSHNFGETNFFDYCLDPIDICGFFKFRIHFVSRINYLNIRKRES